MNPELLYKLRVCRQNGDIQSYLNLLEAETTNPNVDVCILEELGKVYFLCTFSQFRDYNKAKLFFEQAASKNSGPALYFLGCMYYWGTSHTERDVVKARILLEQAYNLGEYSGALILGIIYCEGLSVDVDIPRAKKFFEKANSIGMGYYQYANLCLFDNIEFNDLRDILKFYKKELSSPYVQKKEEPYILRNISLLENSVNTDKICSERKIWDLKELLIKLNDEHKEGYYYRGQNKVYPGPLCASLERNKYSKYPVYYDGDYRLRKYGHLFYFEDRNYMNAKHKWSEEKKLRYLLNSYIRNAFGYSFTMALTQQAGYQSEGLDITFSIDIALFFSSYAYANGRYLLANDDSEYAVIYRWKNLNKPNIDMALQSGYFNSPPLIPTYEIFASLQKCNDEELFYKSLKDYASAILWGTTEGRDYTTHFGHLPLHLLKIPNAYWTNSRIYKQKAALLLRDYVISVPKRNAYLTGVHSPCHEFIYMPDLDLNLCHDLSDPYICDTFVFRKDSKYAKEYLENNGITPSYIYDSDQDDLSHIMLQGWLETYYNDSHQYGCPVIDFSPHSEFDIDYYKLMDMLKQYRAGRSKFQYYFKPIE